MTMLFGCKSAALAGPDFADSMQKVMHLQPYITVRYDMPGNMSEMFGYNSRYAKESPTTLSVDTKSEHKFQTQQWRSSLNLDGGLWDYQNQAMLDLNIELIPAQAKTVKEDVVNRYVDYLNGPDGLNTDVRRSAPGTSDEDFGDFIKPVPDSFDEYTINGFDVLTWSEGVKRRGDVTIYHAIPLSKAQHYLLFAFHYNLSAKTRKEAEALHQKIHEDIEGFMSRVAISPIQ